MMQIYILLVKMMDAVQHYSLDFQWLMASVLLEYWDKLHIALSQIWWKR